MIPLAVFVVCLGIVFLAVVETAFGALMRLPQRLEAERESDGNPLGRYLDDPLTLFVPARILRGLLLVLGVVLLAQPIGTGVRGALELTAAGAVLLVGASHVIPALIVREAPERWLALLLPSFAVIVGPVAPLTRLLLGWLGKPPATSQETRASMEQPRPGPPAPEPASHAPDEQRLLRSVVDFGETLVREVMTPRPDIVAIRGDATIDALRQLLHEQEYSRLPVYADNLDNIIGLMVVKDLIQMPQLPAADRKVSAFMRQAAFVPETKRVADLLREFQQRRFQLAIVVDEYGGTAGLVTVEDVIEELVGEIRDEYDSESDPIVREADGAFVFSAKVAIDDLGERLDVHVDDDGAFETVGGYVLARAGRVPAVGERIVCDGLEIEVLEAERRRIHKVRIRKLGTPGPEGEA
jgi:CBS domain containing-hemolysin-like protein